MLSSEKMALEGIALPQGFGVGSHCTPSAEKRHIFRMFLARFQHLVVCVVGARVGNGQQCKKTCFSTVEPAAAA